MRIHYRIKLYLLSFITFLAVTKAHSQCTVQAAFFPAEQPTGYVSNFFGPDGQTFIACESGQITSISIKMNETPPSAMVPANTYNDTIRLFISDGVNTMFTSSPFSQVFTVTPPLTGVQTITLNTPYPVTGGQTYTFGFRGPALPSQPVLDAGIGIYTDGLPIVNGAEQSGLGDLNFSLEIEPIRPIPTLNQWGLIILILGIFIMGTLFSVRRIRSLKLQ